MGRLKRYKGKKKPKLSPQPNWKTATTPIPVPGITLKRILRGHKDTITQIAWSPDGRFLATPSVDKTIRIWDVARGECVAVLEGHRSGVTCVAWSPDNKYIASGSHDGTIRYWNISLKKCEKSPIRFPDDSLLDISWTPSGKHLICSTATPKNNPIATEGWSWNYQKGKPKELSQLTITLQEFALSPDGKLIASAGYHPDIGYLDILKSINGESIITLDKSSEWRNSYDVTWAPNGRIIATGSQDGAVYLWDPHTGELTHILEGHTENEVDSVSFNYNGQILASHAEDRTIRFWRCDKWEAIAILYEQGPNKRYHSSLAFNPHKNILATLDQKQRSILIWDLDINILLGQTPIDSVRYTTAKLVLVGDSGVGKTGLGWRLAHGKFKEHSSTHGQQFWV
ncbi:MAG: hypothetical protein JSW28_08500, partial [Thermoplasmata archaeon]